MMHKSPFMHMIPNMFVVLFLALVSGSSATVICSDYGRGGGGGGVGTFDSYYTRPIPKQGCIATNGHVNGWHPTHRIEDPASECPGGWKQFRSVPLKCLL